ncbi:MAG: hypothetical protein QOF01_4196 [Thermomicrobiales bacterium]|nr:hypothetical protein [Thermomicrobiales bacterium]
MTRRFMSIVSLFALVLLTMGLAIGFGHGRVAAQDDAAEAHPAHIHSGTCATLGDVVYPLTDVSYSGMGGSPVAESMMGSASAHQVKVSITTVQADLDTILGSEHAINVHESAENIGNYIACGDIGGMVMGSDLAIGLGELNGSGHVGVAWLHDNGDGSTTVSVFLIEPTAMGGMGTPAASG